MALCAQSFGWLTFIEVLTKLRPAAIVVTTRSGRPQIQRGRQPSLDGGAGGGSRTPTSRRTTDFESVASSIPPLRREGWHERRES